MYLLQGTLASQQQWRYCMLTHSQCDTRMCAYTLYVRSQDGRPVLHFQRRFDFTNENIEWRYVRRAGVSANECNLELSLLAQRQETPFILQQDRRHCGELARELLVRWRGDVVIDADPAAAGQPLRLGKGVPAPHNAEAGVVQLLDAHVLGGDRSVYGLLVEVPTVGHVNIQPGIDGL